MKKITIYIFSIIVTMLGSYILMDVLDLTILDAIAITFAVWFLIFGGTNIMVQAVSDIKYRSFKRQIDREE